MASSTNTTYQTVTNVLDPATQAFRNAVFPSLGRLAGRTPTVYGAKWNPEGGTPLFNPDGTPQLDPTNNKPMFEGSFDRDPAIPLTADINKEITDANEMVRKNVGSATPGLTRGAANIDKASGMDIYGAGAGAYGKAGGLYDQAAAGRSGAAGQGQFNAATGQFERAAEGQAGLAGQGQFNAATGQFERAAAGQSGLAGRGQFNAATGMFEQAAGTDTANMYSPYAQQAQGQYGQAGNLYGQSTDALGLSSASPYLQAAGLSSAQNVGQYMNPYNEQVTNRIAELGARNLSENILPSIGSDFIKAGGYGSTRQRDLIGRAARDTQESILAQQSQALQAGYGQGLTASAADLSRYGNLAGTAGSLGTQQQQILQGAGAGIGNLGTAYSNLGSTYANLAGSDAARKLQAGQGLSAIGQANIQASQADLARQIQAGQGLSTIGQSNIQSSEADLARRLQAGQGLSTIGQSNIQASQADLARILAAGQGQAGIGAGLGNLMQANQQGQLEVGRANIDLGTATQAAGYRDAGALAAVGESRQAQDQRVIDANRAQVGAEGAAIFDPVSRAISAAGGTPGAATSTQSTTSTPGASLAGQLAGAAGAVISGAKLLKAKGGAIKKGSLKKSSYGKLPKRGLSMFARAS